MTQISILREIDYNELFFPNFPVGLFNRKGENKCWAISPVQALKACPCFRNHLFRKLTGLTTSDDVTDIWQHRQMYAFWASFLNNALIDPQLSTLQRFSLNCMNSKVTGFFGELFHNNTRFGCIEYPWSYEIFGYVGSYSTGNNNPLEELTSGFNVLEKSLQLLEENIVVRVTYSDVDGPRDSGSFVLLNPLKQVEGDQEKYCQLNAAGNFHKHRIELVPDAYKDSCLQTELTSLLDAGTFSLSEEGKILIVYVEVKIAATDVSFVSSGENAMSSNDIEKVNATGGFQVNSKFKTTELLFLQGMAFVLTATIMNTVSKHFFTNVNGNMDNVWWRIDDNEVKPVRGEFQMQPMKDLSHPSTVCYVFEKVALGDHIDPNALLAQVKQKKTFVNPNNTRTRLSERQDHEFDTNMLRYSEISLFDNDVVRANDALPETRFDVRNMLRVVKHNNPRAAAIVPEQSELHIKGNKRGSREADERIESDPKRQAYTQAEEDVEEVDLKDEDFAKEDDDDVVGKKFWTRYGVDPVQGMVTDVGHDKLGRHFYKVFFKIDNSYDYIIKREMLQLLLNEKNGTLFGSNEREFIISDVRAWRPKANAKKKKVFSPDDVQFEIKWEKGKYSWTDYNITQFKCSNMESYLKNCDDLSYPVFEKHYKEKIKSEWLQYRLVPSVKGDTIKVIKGDGKTLNVSMEEATAFFGAKGVENIRLQYNNLHKTQKKMYFHVATGEEVSVGGSLVDSKRSDERMQDELFSWFSFEENEWFKVQVMRTNGVLCVISSVINACPLDIDFCQNLFKEFWKWHLSTMDIKVGLLFRKVSELRCLDFYFYFKKFKSLISFGELSDLIEEKSNGAVSIVTYITEIGTTHCICWDSSARKILDPDKQNSLIFSYHALRHNCVKTTSIMTALRTTFAVPCISYIAFWRPRTFKKIEVQKNA